MPSDLAANLTLNINKINVDASQSNLNKQISKALGLRSTKSTIDRDLVSILNLATRNAVRKATGLDINSLIRDTNTSALSARLIRDFKKIKQSTEKALSGSSGISASILFSGTDFDGKVTKSSAKKIANTFIKNLESIFKDVDFKGIDNLLGKATGITTGTSKKDLSSLNSKLVDTKRELQGVSNILKTAQSYNLDQIIGGDKGEKTFQTLTENARKLELALGKVKAAQANLSTTSGLDDTIEKRQREIAGFTTQFVKSLRNPSVKDPLNEILKSDNAKAAAAKFSQVLGSEFNNLGPILQEALNLGGALRNATVDDPRILRPQINRAVELKSRLDELIQIYTKFQNVARKNLTGFLNTNLGIPRDDELTALKTASIQVGKGIRTATDPSAISKNAAIQEITAKRTRSETEAIEISTKRIVTLRQRLVDLALREAALRRSGASRLDTTSSAEALADSYISSGRSQRAVVALLKQEIDKRAQSVGELKKAASETLVMADNQFVANKRMEKFELISQKALNNVIALQVAIGKFKTTGVNLTQPDDTKVVDKANVRSSTFIKDAENIAQQVQELKKLRDAGKITFRTFQQEVSALISSLKAVAGAAESAIKDIGSASEARQKKILSIEQSLASLAGKENSQREKANALRQKEFDIIKQIALAELKNVNILAERKNAIANDVAKRFVSERSKVPQAPNVVQSAAIQTALGDEEAINKAGEALNNYDQTIKKTSQTLDELQKAKSRVVATVKDSSKSFRSTSNAVSHLSFSFERLADASTLAIKRFSAFLIPTTGLFAVFSQVQRSVEAFRQFEKVQITLGQILNLNGDALRSYGDRFRELSVITGSSVENIGGAANILAQAGLANRPGVNPQKGRDDLVQATEAIAIAQLGPTFESERQTAEGLVAIFSQFNNKLEDTGRILSIVNQLSKDFAIESADFFEAVSRGGTTFATLGGKFEDFAELLTLVRSETRQSASTLGNFFKSIGARLFRDDILDTLSALNPLIIRTSTIQDRIRAIASATKNLSGQELIGFADEVVGLQQAGRFVALLQAINKNGDAVSKSLANSLGSLSKDAEQRLESVSVSFSRAQRAIESFFVSIIQSDFIRNLSTIFANAITAVTSFVSQFNEVIGGLVGLGVLGAAFQGIKLGGAILQRSFGFNKKANNATEAGLNVSPTLAAQNRSNRYLSSIEKYVREVSLTTKSLVAQPLAASGSSFIRRNAEDSLRRAGRSGGIPIGLTNANGESVRRFRSGELADPTLRRQRAGILNFGRSTGLSNGISRGAAGVAGVARSIIAPAAVAIGAGILGVALDGAIESSVGKIRSSPLFTSSISDVGIRSRQSATNLETIGGVGSGALSGAAIGFMAGQIIPVIGPAIGAAVGAVIGGISGGISSRNSARAGFSADADQRSPIQFFEELIRQRPNDTRLAGARSVFGRTATLSTSSDFFSGDRLNALEKSLSSAEDFGIATGRKGFGVSSLVKNLGGLANVDKLTPSDLASKFQTLDNSQKNTLSTVFFDELDDVDFNNISVEKLEKLKVILNQVGLEAEAVTKIGLDVFNARYKEALQAGLSGQDAYNLAILETADTLQVSVADLTSAVGINAAGTINNAQANLELFIETVTRLSDVISQGSSALSTLSNTVAQQATKANDEFLRTFLSADTISAAFEQGTFVPDIKADFSNLFADVSNINSTGFLTGLSSGNVTKALNKQITAAFGTSGTAAFDVAGLSERISQRDLLVNEFVDIFTDPTLSKDFIKSAALLNNTNKEDGSTDLQSALSASGPKKVGDLFKDISPVIQEFVNQGIIGFEELKSISEGKDVTSVLNERLNITDDLTNIEKTINAAYGVELTRQQEKLKLVQLQNKYNEQYNSEQIKINELVQNTLATQLELTAAGRSDVFAVGAKSKLISGRLQSSQDEINALRPVATSFDLTANAISLSSRLLQAQTPGANIKDALAVTEAEILFTNNKATLESFVNVLDRGLNTAIDSAKSFQQIFLDVMNQLSGFGASALNLTGEDRATQDVLFQTSEIGLSNALAASGITAEQFNDKNFRGQNADLIGQIVKQTFGGFTGDNLQKLIEFLNSTQGAVSIGSGLSTSAISESITTSAGLLRANNLGLTFGDLNQASLDAVDAQRKAGEAATELGNALSLLSETTKQLAEIAGQELAVADQRENSSKIEIGGTIKLEVDLLNSQALQQNIQSQIMQEVLMLTSRKFNEWINKKFGSFGDTPTI